MTSVSIEQRVFAFGSGPDKKEARLQILLNEQEQEEEEDQDQDQEEGELAMIRTIGSLALKGFLIGFMLVGIWGVESQASQFSWNLNDVSYLFPLPSHLDSPLHRSLLNPVSAGPKGELLPLSLYEKLPPLNSGGSGQKTMYDQQFKVLGLRLDPCPQSHSESPECLPELRLIWQPVVFDIFAKKVTTTDLAVHTFYSLTQGQLKTLARDLRVLILELGQHSVTTRGVVLNLHPGFSDLGTQTLLLGRLNSLILKNCGQGNLHKVTFSSLLTANVWWRFGGIAPDQAGHWKLISIPRVQMTFQDIFNSALEEDPPIVNPGIGLDAVINVLPPDYPEDDNLLPIINNGFRNNDQSDYEVFRSKIPALDRFENPQYTNANTLDCATCHYAGTSRYYVESRFSDLRSFATEFQFKNPNPSLHNLQNTTVAAQATRVVRAFGYFGDQPAVNQRTIHESAESADWLNKNNY